MGGADAYRIISLADEGAVPVEDDTLQWIPLRRRLGIRAFGTNAYRAVNAGDQVIEDHVESPGQEEMYVVVAGAARFRVGDDEFEAPHGSAVFLPDPDVRRSAVAIEDETIVLGVGGWPDRPYHSLVWEPIYLAQPALRREDWAEAAAVLEREAGDHLDHPRVQYQLAHCHARLGDSDRAREELHRAIERDPGLRARAEGDDLLAPLLGEAEL